MSTPTDAFDYHLPPEQIAQESIEPRDQSRLLLLDKETGERDHKRFFEIVDVLKEGDVLVFNKTKVFKARLRGKVGEKEVEVFLLREREGVWEAMVRPGKKVEVGTEIDLGGLQAEVVGKTDVIRLKIEASVEEVLAFTDRHGEIPIPPYVENQPEELANYQTVYAEETGSVAAPTAGFHFTERLLDQLKQKGVQLEFVTLHVGIGTFRPVKSETLEEHEMHAEFVQIDAETAARLNEAKSEGRRVIAVGTTTVRALEGVAKAEGELTAFSGDVNLFIMPGFNFKVIDGLITNFHLPKSTLIVLVSALAGREFVLNTYKEAVKMGYRFYSFGDAMFIS